jgi:hypothetical protein
MGSLLDLNLRSAAPHQLNPRILRIHSFRMLLNALSPTPFQRANTEERKIRAEKENVTTITEFGTGGKVPTGVCVARFFLDFEKFQFSIIRHIRMPLYYYLGYPPKTTVAGKLFSFFLVVRMSVPP